MDTQTGRYTHDLTASVDGLPHGLVSTPNYYSPALKRWLPVLVGDISPDGGSYAWVNVLPDGGSPDHLNPAELHRYDVATGTDKALRTSPVPIYVWRWDATGILVSGELPGSPNAPASWWLVDPVTGAAARQVPSSHASLFSFTPLPGDPADASFHTLGVDSEGHMMWWLMTNGKGGGVDWVFRETAPGQRVFIYRDTKDSTAFYPLDALADSTGMWFSDAGLTYGVIWHWQQGTGLRQVMITGLPAPGLNSFPIVRPAGPCR